MKINVIKKLIIMSLIPMTLFFSGCASKRTKPEGEISSISINQNHMSSNNSYAFSAYKNDDSYYLNVWCSLVLDEENYKDVNLDNILITKDEFDEFTKLDKKYDFFSHLKKENKGKNIFQPLDEITAKFQVSYNGESINLETSGECHEAVYNYFIELAEKYSD